MMQEIKDGEPVIHTHSCPKEREGQVMTDKELSDFAKLVLMREYYEKGSAVHVYGKEEPNQADFCFINKGERPNFSLGVSGKRKVNVLFIYKDELNTDISDIDTSWMVEEYRRTGAIPRVTFASAWCLEDECKDGKPAICGGDFYLKYYSVSLIPDEENAPLDKVLSDVELAEKYAESWRQFDASIIAPYLDKDYHYSSVRVFDEMPSRHEYLDYFEAKLDSLKPRAEVMAIGVGRNHQTGEVAVIVKNGDMLTTLCLTCVEGRITAGRIKEYDDRFKVFDPQDELYMNHGDHLDCIMPATELLSKHLQPIIQESKFWKSAHTEVTTDDMYEEVTGVFSLMYGEGEVRMLTTLAASEKTNSSLFMSIYPFGKGVPYEVVVDKVLEWDNQVEATILCSIGEFDFAFFPVDYYCNKEKYKEGAKLTVDLSALGMRVEEGQHGFQFEGQQAIDWLAKTGQEPNYDENGNVEPVKFSLENLVAFLNTNSKCPDEAEFQSPVGEVKDAASILGVEFYKTDVIICRRNTEDGELEVTVPLYFRKEFFPEAKKGDPIRGWLWVTGSVTGAHEEDEEK